VVAVGKSTTPLVAGGGVGTLGVLELTRVTVETFVGGGAVSDIREVA
jgi:hypothetical protein